jgi:hypothetical protein
MPNKANGITSKLLTILIVLAPSIFAHGGFDHVIGSVAQFTNNVLTVQTSTGKVDVKLDEKTLISKGDHKAQTSDLKPGVRVVIDIPEGSKDKVAHAVKLRAAEAVAHDEHHHADK